MSWPNRGGSKISPKRGRSKDAPSRRTVRTSSDDTLDDSDGALEIWELDSDGAGPSKTRTAPTDLRRASPGTRHARFGSQLEQGPSLTRGTSPSPTRSALASPRNKYSQQANQQLEYEANHSGSATSARVPQTILLDSNSEGDLLWEPIKLPKHLFAIADEEKADIELTKALHKLREKIIVYGASFSYTRPKGGRSAVDILCRDPDNVQLLRYVGCLALSGPGGVEGWNELLTGNSLAAVVSGILGRALKEHVFSDLWFGGSEVQKKMLSDLEKEGRDLDGFYRTKDRGFQCKSFLSMKHTRDTLCNNLFEITRAEAELYAKLEKLLLPLWNLRSTSPKTEFTGAMHDNLRNIISDAAYLSREMRAKSEVVYYWPPTFKDEEFEPNDMEVYNLEAMIAGSPYKKQIVQGRETAILQEGQESRKTALVRAVVFPALVAYRQGGGRLAKLLLKAERAQDDGPEVPEDVRKVRREARDSPHKLTGEEGFRTRVLGKSVVVLAWGRQRLLTVEAGTSRHLDAKREGKMGRYEEDREGVVELFDYFLERQKGRR